MARLIETNENRVTVEFTQLETELFHDLADTLNKDYHLMVFEYMKHGVPLELADQEGEFVFKYHGSDPANMVITDEDIKQEEAEKEEGALVG